MGRRLKILYVCPWAHYSGHHPHAAKVEPELLSKAGVDVTLLTFCGITNDPQISVPHFTVVHKKQHILRWMDRNTILRWILMLVETAVTLWKAMRLYRRLKCDAIYLRDGEPFLFMSHLLSIPFRGFRWVVSLTGANLFTPKSPPLRKNPIVYLYVIAQRLMRGRIWWPLYRLSMSRNRFVFVTQNEEAKKGYETHLGSVFAGRVVCIPLGTADNGRSIQKRRARTRLGLPQDKMILLSFGAPNAGKNVEVVVRAVKRVPEAFVVHAGTQAFSLGPNPTKLTEKHGLGDRTKVFDYYVPEEEKPLFFSAADAIVLSYTKVFKSTSSMLWQAAKYGLPVISSDANTLGDMVREYNLGLLFKAEDVQSLASAIRRFMSITPSEIDKVKAGYARFVDDFSHEKWALNNIRVLEEVV